MYECSKISSNQPNKQINVANNNNNKNDDEKKSDKKYYFSLCFGKKTGKRNKTEKNGRIIKANVLTDFFACNLVCVCCEGNGKAVDDDDTVVDVSEMNAFLKYFENKNVDTLVGVSWLVHVRHKYSLTTVWQIKL